MKPPDQTPVRHHSGAARRGVFGVGVALAATLAIAFATLSHGDPAVAEDTSLFCVVCGTHGLTDVVLNVALFFPLGIGLRLAGVRFSALVIAGALLSLAVESAQYTWLTGRSASLSDLLFNTIGTALGGLAVHWQRQLLRPHPWTALRLASGALVMSLGLIAISGWALVPHVGPPPYAVNQIATRPGVMRLYEAPILRSVIDGREYTPPRRIRGPLETTELRPLDPSRIALAAEATPMYPPGMLRPFLLVSSPDSSTLVLLGQREQSLMLRLRVRGASLRLVIPTFALPDAFPAQVGNRSADSAGVARALRLSALHTSAGVELTREGETGRLTRAIARTPLLGWTLLMPFGIAHGRNGELITLLWAMLLLLPGAYWSGRARPAASWAPLAHLVVALSGIMLIARTFALAIPSGLPLAGVLIATWGGAALGAWTCRRLAPPSLAGQVTAS